MDLFKGFIVSSAEVAYPAFHVSIQRTRYLRCPQQVLVPRTRATTVTVIVKLFQKEKKKLAIMPLVVARAPESLSLISNPSLGTDHGSGGERQTYARSL